MEDAPSRHHPAEAGPFLVEMKERNVNRMEGINRNYKAGRPVQVADTRPAAFSRRTGLICGGIDKKYRNEWIRER